MVRPTFIVVFLFLVSCAPQYSRMPGSTSEVEETLKELDLIELKINVLNERVDSWKLLYVENERAKAEFVRTLSNVNLSKTQLPFQTHSSPKVNANDLGTAKGKNPISTNKYSRNSSRFLHNGSGNSGLLSKSAKN